MFLLKDPKIEFESYGDPSPYISENHTWFFFGVFCLFDEVAGNPQVSITIEGHAGEILAEDSVIEQSTDCFYGHHFAAMWLVSNVNITCIVTDDIGTYTNSSLVTLNGEF